MANTTAKAVKKGSKTDTTSPTNEFRLVWLDMEMTGLDP